ncbi:hypothetical protein Xekk_00333 [Xenorhabdus sp. KK7.4]|nr:hypothetical protein Xekk_00333 [Xenorhabdus sp. KK7.4]
MVIHQIIRTVLITLRIIFITTSSVNRFWSTFQRKRYIDNKKEIDVLSIVNINKFHNIEGIGIVFFLQ